MKKSKVFLEVEVLDLEKVVEVTQYLKENAKTVKRDPFLHYVFLIETSPSFEGTLREKLYLRVRKDGVAHQMVSDSTNKFKLEGLEK